MGRIADAWAVLTGRDKAPGVATPADAAMATLLTGKKPPLRGTAGLLLAYSTMPRLRAVLDRIAWPIASTPVQAYRAKGASPKAISAKIASAPHVRGMSRDTGRTKAIKQLVAEGNLEPLKTSRALDTYYRHTPRLTATQRMQVVQAMLDLTGEAFLLKERLGGTEVRELWPIPPTWVTLPEKSDAPFEIGGKMRKTIPQADMIYLRHPDPANPYERGTGIAGTLTDELDADENAAKTASAFFYNQGLPSAIVSFKGEKEQAETLKAKFDAQNRGARKANTVHFTNSDVNVSQLSQKFVDMNLVQLREFESSIIRETLGVPPEILGNVTNSNRATITQANNIFALWALVPRLEFLFDHLNSYLVPDIEEDTVLVYESPVSDDFDFALDVGRVVPYARTLNEWRAWMGDAPLEGKIGDKVFMPFGLVAVDPKTGASEDDKPTEEPAPAPEDDADDSTAEGDDAEKFQVDQSVVIALAEYAPRAERELRAKIEADRVRALEVAKQDSRIDAILSALDPDDLMKIVDPLWRDQILDWMADELRALGADIDVNLIGRLAEEHVRKLSADRITGLVNETTRRELRESLAEGLANGETNRELIGRVSDTMNRAIDARSENIARTETLRSSNWAIWQGQQLGGVEKREWIAIMDQHVRPTHRALHGQVRAVGEPFELGMKRAMYPGDFGDPAEDCSCRCVTVPIIEDEARSVKTPNREVVAKRFDARLRAWDKMATRAIRRGFKAQKKAVMARAEQVLERAVIEGATA